MSSLTQWWFDHADGGDWRLPASRLQGRRPIGGVLVRTGQMLEFCPNRLEAAFGGRPWHATDVQMGEVTLIRRILRISPHAPGGGAPELFVVHRTARARTCFPQLQSVSS